MRKTLAAAISAALIGCASTKYETPRAEPPAIAAVQPPALPPTPLPEITNAFFDQILSASDITPENRGGHFQNLANLEEKIRAEAKITPELDPAETLMRIHRWLFDQNAHRYAHEGAPAELYPLAQPHRIVASDLERAARRVGSSLGLALEYFTLALRFGYDISPHLHEDETGNRIVFVHAGQMVDPTSPSGISDAPENLGLPLTPSQLIGLYLNTKAGSLIISGTYDDAYRTYERAYTLYPKAEITLNLGETANLLGNIRLARQWFEQTARLDSAEHAENKRLRVRPHARTQQHIAHERLGELSFVEGDYAAAERHYMRALELCSTSGTLYAKYGETLHALGRKQEAERFFRRALDLEPHNERLKQGIATYLDD